MSSKSAHKLITFTSIIVNMTKTKITALALLTATSLSAEAQDGIRMPDPYGQLNKREKTRLKTQASNLFNALEPAVKKASASTVSVSIMGRRVAFGTAVRNKQANVAVLTKWSEVSNARGAVSITTVDGKSYLAKVTGVYPEHDLALLTSDAPLKPIDLTKGSKPELGSFLALARPDGKVEGFGVVSVQSRSLREKDKAYLGVMMDFSKAGKGGVPLMRVMPDSAAMKAGLRNGDVVVSVDQTPIVGAMEMRNILQRLVPGSEIIVRFRRGEEEKNATVKLGSRADNANIQRVPRARMERMQRMGTSINRVRSDFPSVVQSDMAIDPNDVGAPVLDLDGKIVGITIARSSRIKTFITPTDTLQRMLAFDANSVAQAMKVHPKPSAQNVTEKPSAGIDDPAAEVRRLLGDIDTNDEHNLDVLRKVEEQLRKLKRDESER